MRIVETYLFSSLITLITRCTIGRGLSLNQTTGISPACTAVVQFHKNKISPRWNAGAMDSDITQTIGTAEFVRRQSPFQAIKGELRAVKIPRMRAREDRSLVGLQAIAACSEERGVWCRYWCSMAPARNEGRIGKGKTLSWNKYVEAG